MAMMSSGHFFWNLIIRLEVKGIQVKTNLRDVIQNTDERIAILESSCLCTSHINSLQKEDVLSGHLELGSPVFHPHDRRQDRQEGVLLQPGRLSSRVWYALLGNP